MKKITTYSKKKYPLVSIVTPAFRSEVFIADLIKCINKIDYPNLEAIIVFDPSDNGPKVARKMVKNDKKWKIIENRNRLGAPRSLNTGIRSAKGEFIAIVNCDMALDTNYIKEIIKFFSGADKSVGACCPKIFDFHHRDRIQAYKMHLLPQTGWIVTDQYGKKDSSRYQKPIETFSGMEGIVVKREVFDKAGFFDEDYEALIYDLEMNWRIWLAGYKVICVPTSQVYHWSLKEGRQNAKWEFFYSKMIDAFIKNYSPTFLLRYLPQLVIIYSLRALLLLIRGKPDAMIGWVKALMWLLNNFPNALEKRKHVQSEVRGVSDEELFNKIFYQNSIFSFYKYLKTVQKKVTPIFIHKEMGRKGVVSYSG